MDAKSLQHKPGILALDWGSVRIGVAVTVDGEHAFARPVQDATDEHAVVQFLKALIKEDDIGLIVMGLPLSMEGKENATTASVRAFAERISKEVPPPIVFEDERLSSVFSKQKQREGSTQSTDSLAALSILENYLAKR